MKRVLLIPLVLALFLVVSSSWAEEKAGGGGGFYVSCSSMSLEPVNSYVADYGFPSFGESLTFFGGGGSGGKGKVEFGGFGGAGESTVFRGTNKAELGIAFGGFRLDYYLRETDKLALITSGGFGYIGASLLLIGEDSAEFTIESCLVYGGIGLRYKLTEWLSLEVGADYNCAGEKNWKRKAGMLPEPEPLDLDGVNVRFGLRFGAREEIKEGTTKTT